MSADDREKRDEAGEREIDLPVDDLNPLGLSPEATDKVKGGIAPPAPPGGPIPIPYPTTAVGDSSSKGTRQPGVTAPSAGLTR